MNILRNILVGLFLVTLPATSRAVTYSRINYQKTITYYWVSWANASESFNGNESVTIQAFRPQGTDPTIDVVIAYKWWGDGTGINTTYWNNYAGYIGGDALVGTGYWLPKFDGRQQQSATINLQKQPGTYSLRLMMYTWASQGQQMVNVDITGTSWDGWTNSDDPNSGGGGTGTGGTGLTDTDKSWFESWFTMSDSEKVEWETVKGQLTNWGPIGYFTGISGQLNAGQEAQEPTTDTVGSHGNWISVLMPTDVPASSHVVGYVDMNWSPSNNTFSYSSQSGSATLSMDGGDATTVEGRYTTIIANIRMVLASFLVVLFGLMVWKRLIPMIARGL